jgi:hypothetical protein
MDPLFLYLGLAVLGLALFAAVSGVAKGTMRRCPGCDEDVSFTARKCRHCGYGFS